MSEINEKLELIAKQSPVVKKKNLFGEVVEDKSGKAKAKSKPKDKE